MCHLSVAYMDNGTCHYHVELRIEGYVDCSTTHVNCDRWFAQSQLVGNGGGSAAAAARCVGIPSATLPNFDSDVVPIYDLHKLDIGSIGEQRVLFYQRAITARLHLRRLFDRDNTMGVTNGGSTEPKSFVAHNNFFQEHISG